MKPEPPPLPKDDKPLELNTKDPPPSKDQKPLELDTKNPPLPKEDKPLELDIKGPPLPNDKPPELDPKDPPLSKDDKPLEVDTKNPTLPKEDKQLELNTKGPPLPHDKPPELDIKDPPLTREDKPLELDIRDGAPPKDDKPLELNTKGPPMPNDKLPELDTKDPPPPKDDKPLELDTKDPPPPKEDKALELDTKGISLPKDNKPLELDTKGPPLPNDDKPLELDTKEPLPSKDDNPQELKPKDQSLLKDDKPAPEVKKELTEQERRRIRVERNMARVKIMSDKNKGFDRFEDVDAVDEALVEHMEMEVKKFKSGKVGEMDRESLAPESVVVKQKPVKVKRKKEKKENETTSTVASQVDVEELDSGVKKKDEGTEDDLPFDEDKSPPFIGFFNDSVRRIDFIIVVEDNFDLTTQEIKTAFLENVVKTGLQLEFAGGVLRKNKHLNFIKVHATDKVLEDYADTFGMKKLFRDKHLEFVKEKKTLFNSYFIYHHEREWLKLVRGRYIEPLRYSNLERSYIVYMLLLHMRYGEPNNYYSLTRLINNKIIIDAYALHDGPYFYVPRQNFAHVTARQILFYTWIGCENMFKLQPKHLIYEYFGPRIGFYFTFYEYYNKALIIAMMAFAWLVFTQVVTFLSFKSKLLRVATTTYGGSVETLRACNSKQYYNSIHFGQKATARKDEDVVCPKCRNFTVCPFMQVKEYCDSVYIKSFYDSLIPWYQSILTCFLVILFVIFWKRAENYWAWIWELGHPPKRHIVRPEYRTQFKSARRSKLTGIWVEIKKKTRTIVMYRFMMMLLGMIAIGGTIGLIYLNYFMLKKYSTNFEKKKVTKEYIFLAATTIAGLVASFFIEMISHCISYLLVKCENHRLYEDFEKSYIKKLFSCSYALTFPFLIYTALIKGQFYYTPIYNYAPRFNVTLFKQKWSFEFKLLGELYITNCGYWMGCLDEVLLIFTLTIIFKAIAVRAPSYLWRLRTDYNQGEKVNRTVPSWEREYELPTITENDMTLKVNALVVQIALLASFALINVFVLPLVLLSNLVHLRHEARRLLLNYRRPLLYRCVGLQAWSGIFYFILVSSALIMPLMVVTSTDIGLRNVFYNQYNARYKARKESYRGNLAEERITYFRTEYYSKNPTAAESISEYKGFYPTFCFFPGIFEKKKWPDLSWKLAYRIQDLDTPGEIVPTIRHFHLKYYRAVLFITFLILIACIFTLVKYYIPTTSKSIKEISHMERNIIRVHLQNMKTDGKHTVDPIVG